MAKTVMPLMSAEASGQFAKTLVYMNWKGIQDVRKYVIPANPKTPDQQGQRAKLTAAVDEWHNAGYTIEDRTAWNAFAATLAEVMAGFNAMIRVHIKKAILAKTWQRIFDGTLTTPSSAKINFSVDSTDEATKVNAKWGYSPTFMPITTELAFAAGKWGAVNIAAIANAWVYCHYIQEPAEKYGRTGIYKVKVKA